MSASVLHPTALRPWQPMTDAEWEAIRRFLPPHEGRGRPSDKRRTMDAVFWIAASKEPWKALPSHMGNGESIARTLRRWARAGWLDRLLVAISDHPLGGGCETLRKMSWLICRAFRRMARIVGVDSLRLAKNLRLRDAWPAIPLRLPDPDLSETGKKCVWAANWDPAMCSIFEWTRSGAYKSAYKLAIAGLRLVRDARGNLYKWRLR